MRSTMFFVIVVIEVTKSQHLEHEELNLPILAMILMVLMALLVFSSSSFETSTRLFLPW